MGFRIQIKYIPIAVLICAISYCFYLTQISTIVFQKEHYRAIGLLLSSLMVTIISFRFGVLLTLVTLILGVFNFVAFTPTISYYTFEFSINSLHIKFEFQLFSFVILFALVSLNFKVLKSFVVKPAGG